MIGYIVTDKPELKIKDYEAYKGYYCGICKATGRKYGQLPRFALSYDFAFLAVLIDALQDKAIEAEQQHCMIHPLKKIQVVVNNSAIDYSTDIMLLLVYYNLLDDRNDNHKIRGTAGSVALKNRAMKVEKKYPTLAKIIEDRLNYLSNLEKSKSPSIDLTGDAFSDIMREVFAGEGVQSLIDSSQIRQLAHLGKNIGRLIYLLDALDDLEEDIKSKNYNPIIYRFNYNIDDNSEEITDFRKRIRPQMEIVLMSCLTEIESAYSLMDIKKNRNILDNIIYFGLLRQTEKILTKGTEDNEKPV